MNGPWRNPCPVCGARQPPCKPECGFHPVDEDLELPSMKCGLFPWLDCPGCWERCVRIGDGRRLEHSKFLDMLDAHEEACIPPRGTHPSTVTQSS